MISWMPLVFFGLGVSFGTSLMILRLMYWKRRALEAEDVLHEYPRLKVNIDYKDLAKPVRPR